MNYHEREAINKMDDMLTDKTEEEDYTFLQVTSRVLSKSSFYFLSTFYSTTINSTVYTSKALSTVK